MLQLGVSCYSIICTPMLGGCTRLGILLTVDCVRYSLGENEHSQNGKPCKMRTGGMHLHSLQWQRLVCCEQQATFLLWDSWWKRVQMSAKRNTIPLAMVWQGSPQQKRPFGSHMTLRTNRHLQHGRAHYRNLLPRCSTSVASPCSNIGF